jgi:nicotinamidase-related amidase
MDLPGLRLNRSALLILDMQQAFFDETGVLEQSGLIQPVSAKDRNRLVSNGKTLLEIMRAKGRPVVFVNTGFRADLADCFLSPPWRDRITKESRCLIEGTASAAVIDELYPREGDFVLTKKTHGAFQYTCLDRLLSEQHVDTCVLVGNLFSGMDETLIEGGALGYDFVVAADCSFPLDSPDLESVRHHTFIESTADIVAQMQNVQKELPVAKPAMIMIDLQNDSLHPAGANHRMGRRGYTEQQLNEIVSNNEKIAAAMRARGLPVICVKFVKRMRGRNVDFDTASSKMYRRLHVVPDGVDNCTDGTWGADFIDELKARDGDFVLTKRSSSAFSTTHLHRLLRNLDVNVMWLTGGSVSGCLEATMREGIALGYRAVVVSDATYPPNERSMALQRLSKRAEVSSTNDVLGRLYCDWKILAP